MRLLMPRVRRRIWTPRSSSRLFDVRAIHALLGFGLSRTVPSAVKSPWRNPMTASRGAPNSEAGPEGGGGGSVQATHTLLDPVPDLGVTGAEPPADPAVAIPCPEQAVTDEP